MTRIYLLVIRPKFTQLQSGLLKLTYFLLWWNQNIDTYIKNLLTNIFGLEIDDILKWSKRSMRIWSFSELWSVCVVCQLTSARMLRSPKTRICPEFRETNTGNKLREILQPKGWRYKFIMRQIPSKLWDKYKQLIVGNDATKGTKIWIHE